jgi:hypothetical protein
MEPVIVKRTRGAELFEKWLRDTKTTLADVGKSMGKSHVAVLKWRTGEFRPETIERAKLEKLTSGFVAADSWLTEDEQKSLSEIQPLCTDAEAAQ